MVSFLSVPLTSSPSHTWDVLGAQNDGCPQYPSSSSQLGLDPSFALFSHLTGDGAQGWSRSGGQLLLSSLHWVHPGFGRGLSQKNMRRVKWFLQTVLNVIHLEAWELCLRAFLYSLVPQKTRSLHYSGLCKCPLLMSLYRWAVLLPPQCSFNPLSGPNFSQCLAWKWMSALTFHLMIMFPAIREVTIRYF